MNSEIPSNILKVVRLGIKNPNRGVLKFTVDENFLERLWKRFYEGLPEWKERMKEKYKR